MFVWLNFFDSTGIGLQLTNILRDVGEDLERGRIYLPLDEIRAFGLTEDDLFRCVSVWVYMFVPMYVRVHVHVLVYICIYLWCHLDLFFIFFIFHPFYFFSRCQVTPKYKEFMKFQVRSIIHFKTLIFASYLIISYPMLFCPILLTWGVSCCLPWRLRF